MSDFHEGPGRGFRHPKIAVSDQRTGAVIDLPEAVAVALLEQEPGVRRAYEKYFKMAGQWIVPPEQRRGRLIVIDQELVQRVLGKLPAGVLRELRAELPDGEDSPEQEEGLLENPPPDKQLPLDRHLQELGDQYDPDSPMFISPRRRTAKPPASRRPS